ncbi:MAG: dTDP-4-dehydrorhamnose reductase [Chitinivibrionales bacterium]|nr:dTDP-4-dehydrorhamnose reductase [Chitinivibrionales bacterium]
MNSFHSRFNRLLVVGCNGQLGQDMVLSAQRAAAHVTGLDIPNIDITDLESTAEAVDKTAPGLIINCAAYAAVDACEVHRDEAFAVNDTGTKNLARCARDAGVPLVHISTDYVFDGTRDRPYIETDQPGPKTAYGASKLAGERGIEESMDSYFIFRIAWLYGNRGKNFVKTITKLAQNRRKEQTPLRVVNDQRGSPTYTMEVCRQILTAVQTGKYGLYHCTAEGSCTWYEFACHVLRQYGISTPVEPCTTEEFPRPAQRPANSVLENAGLKKLGVHHMKSWNDAFSEFLTEERQIQKGLQQ